MVGFPPSLQEVPPYIQNLSPDRTPDPKALQYLEMRQENFTALRDHFMDVSGGKPTITAPVFFALCQRLGLGEMGPAYAAVQNETICDPTQRITFANFLLFWSGHLSPA